METRKTTSEALTRTERWIGLKARPLLRIRYGSDRRFAVAKADVSLVAEGANIWRRSRIF
jgi:hypothetical protein